MPKARAFRLVPSGSKLKEVAQSSAVIGLLLSSFLETTLAQDPTLADTMLRQLQSYRADLKPEYQVTVSRAINFIESIRES